MKNDPISTLEPPALEESNPPVASGLSPKKTTDFNRYLRMRQIVKPHGVLPICRSTFLNWIRSGRISPGVKVGRVRLYKESSIYDLLSRLEAQEAPNE